MSVQIQAYLDNVFDVGGLLEDAETKNVALEKVEELEDHLSHVRTIIYSLSLLLCYYYTSYTQYTSAKMCKPHCLRYKKCCRADYVIINKQ